MLTGLYRFFNVIIKRLIIIFLSSLSRFSLPSDQNGGNVLKMSRKLNWSFIFLFKYFHLHAVTNAEFFLIYFFIFIIIIF